ncbi:dihydroorotase [Halorhodospira neutriphila]|uniref:Dihydroorotase n=1 Tax=Halorhodospira neutriphila TaxID=168379 RepID=A0ABS1E8A2_9GAMM|nr:dihydroorotase [Halorhodospira neutriphila]MBK1727312.1 dihydroorotase [Halorhodospira neutriphila]
MNRTTLTLPRPDDWHLHLRDGALMQAVAPLAAASFARAIVMPNLQPPITTTERAAAYRRRILAALPAGTAFEPLMTLYLTDNTPAAEIERAAASGIVHAVKLYPAGATTHSDDGVTDLARCTEALAAMAEHGLPLLIHGERIGAGIDLFDRERAFLEETLPPLRDRHPRLKIVLEHVSTALGAELVTGDDPRLAGTFTPQHLLYSRDRLLAGGLKPHYYCMPILKREADREALLEAATSGHPRVFLGTDSAPHPRRAKESACCSAGCFSSPVALGLYAEAFEAAGALERLEAFASRNGPAFYGLPVNDERVVLAREEAAVPEAYPAGGEDTVVPLRAGESLAWRLRAEASG